MRLPCPSLATIDWSSVPETRHPGTRGEARMRTWSEGGLQVRMVSYSANYEADHWCSKGHVVLGMNGILEVELRDGRHLRVSPGVTLILPEDDAATAHLTRSHDGATLYIVD